MAFSLLGRLVDLYTFIENVVKHPAEKQISISVIHIKLFGLIQAGVGGWWWGKKRLKGIFPHVMYYLTDLCADICEQGSCTQNAAADQDSQRNRLEVFSPSSRCFLSSVTTSMSQVSHSGRFN